MTAQVAEKLRYKGKNLRMCTEPLEPYLEIAKINHDYSRMSTACWRGYQGVWEIVDDHLYLIKIDAEILTPAGNRPVTLRDYFPDAGKRVFAHWYSGIIHCTHGKILKYIHGGYASRFEEDIFLTIERGKLIDERHVINTKDALESDD